MNVIVIGGAASGEVIDIRADATFIQLARKLRPKVLPSADAPMEFETIASQYEVHPISLVNTHEPDIKHLLGFAVVQGMTLVQGMQALMAAYQEKCFRDPPTAPTKKVVN